jgi:hypothetical protein
MRMKSDGISEYFSFFYFVSIQIGMKELVFPRKLVMPSSSMFGFHLVRNYYRNNPCYMMFLYVIRTLLCVTERIVTCNVTVDGYWISNWIYCALQPIITVEYLNSSTINSVDSVLYISLYLILLLHGPRYIAWEQTP